MNSKEVDGLISSRRSAFSPADEENNFRYKPDYPAFHEDIREKRLCFLKAFRKAVVPVLERHINRKTLQHAIEIGTGTGFFARDLAPKWLKERLLSMDINLPSLRKLQHEQRKLQVVRGSVYSLPLASESMDAVIGYSSFDSFLHLPQALKEAKRVLKKDGKLVLFQDLATELYKDEKEHLSASEQPLTLERYHQALLRDVSGIGLRVVEGEKNYLEAGAIENPNLRVLRRLWGLEPLPAVSWDRGCYGPACLDSDLYRKIKQREGDVDSIVRIRYLVTQKE